ncbi:hypothetical protein, partial [Acinetobacter bereziniae]|uniref:hypothetical protein n=1 Tax=Acinetobacter bereziniae TaxID=106648 RepID=UPI001C099879
VYYLSIYQISIQQLLLSLIRRLSDISSITALLYDDFKTLLEDWAYLKSPQSLLVLLLAR